MECSQDVYDKLNVSYVFGIDEAECEKPTKPGKSKNIQYNL